MFTQSIAFQLEILLLPHKLTSLAIPIYIIILAIMTIIKNVSVS
jgi:hypothetical protein